MSDGPSLDGIKALRIHIASIFDTLWTAHGWNEDRWEQFVHLVDASGRAVFGWPQEYDAAGAIREALDEAEVAIGQARGAIDAASEDLRRSIEDLRAERAAKAAHIVTAPEPEAVSKPGPDYAETIPVAEPAAITWHRVIFTGDVDPAPAAEPTPTPVASRRDEPKAPLLCPDCGREFQRANGLASHLRSARPGAGTSWDREATFAAIRERGSLKAAEVALGLANGTIGKRLNALQKRGELPADIAATRTNGNRPRVAPKAPLPAPAPAPVHSAPVVTEIPTPDWPSPLPTRAGPDAFAEFAERRAQGAKAVTDRTWAERHPGEVG